VTWRAELVGLLKSTYYSDVLAVREHLFTLDRKVRTAGSGGHARPVMVSTLGLDVLHALPPRLQLRQGEINLQALKAGGGGKEKAKTATFRASPAASTNSVVSPSVTNASPRAGFRVNRSAVEMSPAAFAGIDSSGAGGMTPLALQDGEDESAAVFQPPDTGVLPIDPILVPGPAELAAMWKPRLAVPVDSAASLADLLRLFSLGGAQVTALERSEADRLYAVEAAHTDLTARHAVLTRTSQRLVERHAALTESSEALGRRCVGGGGGGGLGTHD
jgi:hypothetical protein